MELLLGRSGILEAAEGPVSEEEAPEEHFSSGPESLLSRDVSVQTEPAPLVAVEYVWLLCFRRDTAISRSQEERSRLTL